ncbi:MAG TPA: hypothetical protein VGF67_06665 [Ktedonobacteraceae bacterium]|jgi:hypothetical protein
MPDLPLQHVIFARVERAYSPRNVSGYQIVYQSPDLGLAVTQIEKRLQCFEIDRQGGERYQFFWTQRQQAVLAKTVPLLAPDPEVIDAGRRAAFLAHALVIERQAFATIRNDPFAVFEAARTADLFAQDVEHLVAYLREHPPAHTLATPWRMPGDVAYLLDTWPLQDLAGLFHLGMQTSASGEPGRSLLLLSEDQDELYNLLFLLTFLIPPSRREACTFDTRVDGCYPPVGSFWAMGGSKDRPHPGLLSVHLQDQQLFFKRGGDGSFPYPKALRCAPSSSVVWPGYAAAESAPGRTASNGDRHPIRSAMRGR